MKKFFYLIFLLFSGEFLFSQQGLKEIVDLSEIIPEISSDIKYATTENFAKQKLYTVPKIYGAIATARDLKIVQDSLRKRGLGIRIYDLYRPRIVQFLMWEIVPDANFVADPKSGSRHNRGSAVDLTLYDLKTGKDLAMPTPFDDFTEKASHSYTNLPDSIKVNRALLKTIMESNNFESYNAEWWHYINITSKNYPLKDYQLK
jgi:zinc D-Ala-D-Ala dipeptidase